MEIIKLTEKDIKELEKEQLYLNSFFNEIKPFTIHKKLTRLKVIISQKKIKTRTCLSNSLIDFNPISKEEILFKKMFENYNQVVNNKKPRRKNHFIQRFIINNVIKDKQVKEINFIEFYHHYFENLKKCNLPMLKKFKEDYLLGFDELFNSIIRDMINSDNKPVRITRSLENSPSTKAINNYIEDLLKVGEIESLFVDDIKNKKMCEKNIIRYNCLSFARSSENYFIIAKLFSSLNSSNKSFFSYCILQIFYGLMIIRNYYLKLGEILKNIKKMRIKIYKYKINDLFLFTDSNMYDIESNSFFLPYSTKKLICLTFTNKKVKINGIKFIINNLYRVTSFFLVKNIYHILQKKILIYFKKRLKNLFFDSVENNFFNPNKVNNVKNSGFLVESFENLIIKFEK